MVLAARTWLCICPLLAALTTHSADLQCYTNLIPSPLSNHAATACGTISRLKGTACEELSTQRANQGAGRVQIG